jgi:hypothetical protein
VSGLDHIDDLITTARPQRGRRLIPVTSVHKEPEVGTMTMAAPFASAGRDLTAGGQIDGILPSGNA